MSTPLTDEQYLELFKINEDKYIIGIFQDGITVYKQQIRTLNIFHALYKTKLKPFANDKNYQIGIIGAGVAGLTFAAAALEAGFRVLLYEKTSVYLHMQFGCDIRKIHPNLYEWPDKNYINPYAELPLLDWKHDSASNVVKQIIRGWEKIKTAATASDLKGVKTFEKFMSCEKIEVKRALHKGKLKYGVSHKGEESATNFCDLLIYATGYGVESGVDSKANTPSYWRNDYYAQIDMHKEAPRYIISGVGDGGLIDLFRLKIFDFSYEVILDIIENPEGYTDLYPKLVEAKEQIQMMADPPARIYYTLFSDIHEDFYRYIYEGLKSRDLIRSTKIILNSSKDDFAETLDYKRVSFLHAFLMFVLMHYQSKIGLDYVGGKLTWNAAGKPEIPGFNIKEKDAIIVRHGTNRLGSLPAELLADEEDCTLKTIEDRQIKFYNHGNVEPRWSNSDLLAIFNPESKRSYEYLNPNTTILCTNFVAGLASLIKSYRKDDSDFRLTLFRPLFVKGEYYFQQITSYFGTKPSSDNNSIGQVFKIDRGNIGLSFKTGKATLIVNDDEVAFKDLIDKLNLSEDFDSIDKNKSFFTLPILADIGEGNLTTNLVLCIDSPNAIFIDVEKGDLNLIELICSSANGFVETIHHHITYDEISMVPADYPPLIINGEIDDAVEHNTCFKAICKDEPNLAPENTKLIFNELYTFNLII